MEPRKLSETRICSVCGNGFTNPRAIKTCSPECRQLATKVSVGVKTAKKRKGESPWQRIAKPKKAKITVLSSPATIPMPERQQVLHIKGGRLRLIVQPKVKLLKRETNRLHREVVRRVVAEVMVNEEPEPEPTPVDVIERPLDGLAKLLEDIPESDILFGDVCGVGGDFASQAVDELIDCIPEDYFDLEL